MGPSDQLFQSEPSYGRITMIGAVRAGLRLVPELDRSEDTVQVPFLNVLRFLLV